MNKRSLAVALISPWIAAAASAQAAADLDAEYRAVRTIALRDPKVRAAYEEADRLLARKIVEIDPALKGYAPGRGTGAAPAAKPTPTPTPVAKKVPPAKPVVRATPKPAAGPKHTVKQGETLTGIAADYGVTVATLKSANRIADERKLAVGQVLVVPGGKAPARKAAKPTPKPAEREKSWWERIGA